MATDRISWVNRLSLVWLLTATVFIELSLNRLGVQLLGVLGRNVANAPATYGVTVVGALFAQYFTGTLALLMLAVALWRLFVSPDLFDRVGRGGIAIGAAVFWPLAVVALVGLRRSGTIAYLTISFSALLVLLVLAFLRSSATARTKLGGIYLVLPILARGWSTYVQQLDISLVASRYVTWARRAANLSNYLGAGGAWAVLSCFAPLSSASRLFRGGPVALAAIATFMSMFFTANHYPMTTAIARYGFDLYLPPLGSVQLQFYAISVFPFLLSISSLLSQKGTAAITGQALVLLALCGLHQDLSHLAVATLVAFVQLFRAQMTGERPNASAVTIAQRWRCHLQRLANALQGENALAGKVSEPVTVSQKRREIVRINGSLADIPYAVRIAVSRKGVEEFECDVGSPPTDRSPIALSRKYSRSSVRTAADVAAEHQLAKTFSIQDETGTAEDILSPMASDVTETIEGWLGIWPAEGLRYVVRPAHDGLPDMLRQVSESTDQVDVAALMRLLRVLHQAALKFDVAG